MIRHSYKYNIWSLERRLTVGDPEIWDGRAGYDGPSVFKGTNSNRTVAKFGIAPDFGSGGRGFESHRLMVPCQLNKGTDSKFTE